MRVLFVYFSKTVKIAGFAVKRGIMNIGEMILKHRKAAGLTQKQLADLAGVGKTVVFDLEKGKETIRFSTLKAVLEVLNIQIEFKSSLTGDD